MSKWRRNKQRERNREIKKKEKRGTGRKERIETRRGINGKERA